MKLFLILPVMAFLYSCSAQASSEAPAAYFVSPSGNDTNSGLMDAPFRSVSHGVGKACYLGVSNVYVAAGNYTPGNGLSNSGAAFVNITTSGYISVSGGWNSSFTAQDGVTVLDAQFTGGVPLMALNQATNAAVEGFTLVNSSGSRGGIVTGREFLNITLSNLTIANGSASDGGGIYLEQGRGLLIADCLITNTDASYQGGGIVLWSVSGASVKAEVRDAWSTIRGGGMAVIHTSDSVISVNIINSGISNAERGGAMFITGTNNGLTLHGCVLTNINAQGNSVLYFSMNNSDNNIKGPSVFTGLIVSNNRLGGTGLDTGIAVDNVTLSNHVLCYNLFLTNTLNNLYNSYLITEIDNINNSFNINALASYSNTVE